jgi:hypothetical protein
MDPNLVRDRDTFTEFLQHMRLTLADPALADEWENPDLRGFLAAMEAWVHDLQGPLPDNPWQLVATLFAAAKIYE